MSNSIARPEPSRPARDVANSSLRGRLYMIFRARVKGDRRILQILVRQASCLKSARFYKVLPCRTLTGKPTGPSPPPSTFPRLPGQTHSPPGGNAIDAALATAVSLTVALPDNCALGGDMIALLREPDGTVTTINSSGPAAAAVSAEELRQKHGQTMPTVGPSTVTVPGILAGWEALWRHGANLRWSDAFAVGIEQAKDGVPVGPSVATALIVEQAHLRDDPGLTEIFYPGGDALTVGERLVQPQLAETLEQIRDYGPAAFYSGPLGESFLDTLNACGSDLSEDDLASFEPEVTAALRGTSSASRSIRRPPTRRAPFG